MKHGDQLDEHCVAKDAELEEAGSEIKICILAIGCRA